MAASKKGYQVDRIVAGIGTTISASKFADSFLFQRPCPHPLKYSNIQFYFLPNHLPNRIWTLSITPRH